MTQLVELHIADRMIAFSKITGNGMNLKEALHHPPKLCGGRAEGDDYVNPFYFYRNRIYAEIETVVAETVKRSIGAGTDPLIAGVNMNQMALILNNDEILIEYKDICLGCKKLAQEFGIMIFETLDDFKKVCRY